MQGGGGKGGEACKVGEDLASQQTACRHCSQTGSLAGTLANQYTSGQGGGAWRANGERGAFQGRKEGTIAAPAAPSPPTPPPTHSYHEVGILYKTIELIYDYLITQLGGFLNYYV